MVFDLRDIELLRLAGRYRWLPYGSFDKYGFEGVDKEIDILVNLGLLVLSRSREYIRLSDFGYQLLKDIGYEYTPKGRRAYSGSATLRRRLETVDIMLTTLRAGIYTLTDDIEALRRQPMFYPAFSLRPAMMNSASCSAFGHWGNTAYMVHYISPGSTGLYRVNEFSTFYNLSSVFRENGEVPMAMILAGISYSEIYGHLCSRIQNGQHGKNGFVDFRELYRTSEIPVHLVACNNIGAKQLAVMCQTDYKKKMAKAAYGQKWRERDPEIPEADGCVEDTPIVIAVDMNLQRVESVVSAAKALQRPDVRIAAFEEQILEVLHPMFPRDKPGNIVSLLRIGDDMLNAAFSGMRLYNMSTEPARDRGGGFIYV